MTNSKIARLTGSLLARKGEAKPAASVIDFNMSSMFNGPAEVPRGNPATHPVAAPDTARPAAGTSYWEEPDLDDWPDGANQDEAKTVDPEVLPDPDVLLRQLTGHRDFHPLDSTGTPSDEPLPESGPVGHSDHPSKRHALTVRLDPDRYQRFKALTQDGGRTNQEILSDALNRYLDAYSTDDDFDRASDQQHHDKPIRDDEVNSLRIELKDIRVLLEKLLDGQQSGPSGMIGPHCPTI